ncbi:MAG: winged helix-turn-helix domain-containing protein [Methanosarcinaceae archaeon]
MTEPVLIEAMGDSVNLRILNFFIENPFDGYGIYQISRLVEVSRNSVYRYIPEFVDKGYLVSSRKGSRVLYRLNRRDPMVRLIDKFVMDVGKTYIDRPDTACTTSYPKGEWMGSTDTVAAKGAGAA